MGNWGYGGTHLPSGNVTRSYFCKQLPICSVFVSSPRHCCHDYLHMKKPFSNVKAGWESILMEVSWVRAFLRPGHERPGGRPEGSFRYRLPPCGEMCALRRDEGLQVEEQHHLLLIFCLLFQSTMSFSLSLDSSCREFARWKVNNLALERKDFFSLPLPLAPEFIRNIRLLGRRPNLQQVTENLIKKYGTHFLLSATLGGKQYPDPALTGCQIIENSFKTYWLASLFLGLSFVLAYHWLRSFFIWCICEKCNLLTSKFTSVLCSLLKSILLGKGCGVRTLGDRQAPTKHLPAGGAPSFLLIGPLSPQVSPYPNNIGCGYNCQTHRQRSKCPLSPWPFCSHSIKTGTQPNQFQ